MMMKAGFTSLQLRLAVMFLSLITLPGTEAVTITSTGPQTIQKAKGETVTLGCTFTSTATDTGDLDIEWSNVQPDMTQKDKLILSYSGGQAHFYDPHLAKRVNFSADPTKGDASITFSKAEASDTGTYQCKVKKLPGVDMRKVTLVIMVPPSTPKCWVGSSEEKGGTVSLRCESSQGSTPLSYVWSRETGGAMPSTATQNSQSGELLLKNHTDSNTGTYLCMVTNPVGKGQCQYDLRAYNPTNKAGVIAGAVIGALLLFLLLLLLILFLCCCCCKKRREKEGANEIREDVRAPESRPPSRQSSRQVSRPASTRSSRPPSQPASRPTSMRSVTGYRSHQGIQYNAVPSPLLSVGENGQIYMDGSDGSAMKEDRSASRNYDPRFGYAV